jgi:hypothetical protein
MNALISNAVTGDTHLSKEAEVHLAVEGALRDLEAHAGEEGYRHLFDKALHVLVAIDQAGFRIVRKRSKLRRTGSGNDASHA